MGPSKALIAWVAFAVVLTALPSASASIAGSPTSSLSPASLDGIGQGKLIRLAASESGPVPLPSTAAAVQSAQGAAQCAPNQLLERNWYGARIRATDVLDVGLLVPVEVVGEVQRLVPGAELLGPVIETVESVADVAVVASWDEEYLDWEPFVDRLYVGPGAADAASMSSFKASGWDVVGTVMRCDADARGLSLVRAVVTEPLHYACLLCTGLPADGWTFSNILDVQVRLATAGDYATLQEAMGEAAIPLCPGAVTEAIANRIDDLGLSYEDAVSQQVQRQIAGLPLRT